MLARDAGCPIVTCSITDGKTSYVTDSCQDTGSDSQCIPAALLDALDERGIEYFNVRIPANINVQVVLADGSTTRCARAVRLPRLEFHLRGRTSPVTLVNWIFYVLEGSSLDNTILIGNPVIKHVWGVDVLHAMTKLGANDFQAQDYLPLQEEWAGATFASSLPTMQHPPLTVGRLSSHERTAPLHGVHNGDVVSYPQSLGSRHLGAAISLASLRIQLAAAIWDAETPAVRLNLIGIPRARNIQGRRYCQSRHGSQLGRDPQRSWTSFATDIGSLWREGPKNHAPSNPPDEPAIAAPSATIPDEAYSPRPGRYGLRVSNLRARLRKRKRKVHDIRIRRCSRIHQSAVDVASMLPTEATLAFTRRLLLRRVTLFAAATRWQIPRTDDNIAKMAGVDFLDEDMLASLRQPYLNEEGVRDPDPDYEAFDVLTPPSREVLDELNSRIAAACVNMALDTDQQEVFTKLCLEFSGVFAAKMGLESPARIAPLQVQLRPGARPLKTKLRSYSPAATNFLQDTIREMERMGLVYRNDNARWVAPVMVVPKPGKPGEFRLVVDLRWINHNTEPIQYGMPILEDTLHKIKGSKYFFNGDFLKGFWQVLVHEDSQHLFSFMTPNGVYSPTRLPMGAVDSPLYFQACLTSVFKDLIQDGSLQLWIDDLLGYSDTFEGYMQVLRRILTQCRTYNLKLNIDKTTLGDVKAHWCGRDITGDGVKLQAREAAKFASMAPPTTAGELGEFLHCLNWMRSCLLRFQETSAPLWDVFNKAKATLYGILDSAKDKATSTANAKFAKRARASAQKKRHYESIHLASVGWDAIHEAAFQEVKQLMDKAMELAHWDPNDASYTMCLFTDASHRHYAALLTQVKDWDATKPVYEQQHEPLKTFSGEFRNAQLKWSTIEKESFPIIEALSAWQHFLLNPQGFRIYCDHANLVSLWKPESINPALSKSALDKVYRWVYMLSSFKVRSMEHLPGQHNLWADMLSRWAHPTYYKTTDGVTLSARAIRKRNKREEAKLVRQGRDLNEFLNLQFSPLQTDGKFPSLDIIAVAQTDEHLQDEDREFLEANAEGMTRNARGMWLYGDKVWIPRSNRELILRVMIMAHCGESGHRSEAHTCKYVDELFWWDDAHADLSEFCRHCLCCEKTKTGTTVPRPLGESVKGQFVNEVVHFDYMQIGKSPVNYDHDYQYVLVLKDDFSGLVELIPARTCDHVTVVNALQYWQARYGPIRVLVSDQGSHFKNQVMTEYVLRPKGLSVPQTHHFTMAYTPWANGTVERVNRDIKNLLTILTMESRLHKHDWPFVLPHVMSVINATPSVRLGGYAPREVFMGLPQFNPLHVIYSPRMGALSDVPIASVKVQELTLSLLESLRVIHTKVDDARGRVRKRNFDSTSTVLDGASRTVRHQVDFDVGDFVLMAVPYKLQSKLQAIWRGPYRVVRIISAHIYEVEHLVSGLLVEAHIQRLKFFADSDMDVTIPLQDTITQQDTSGYFFERIIDYMFFDNNHWVRIQWVGFSVLEATWEPLDAVHADDPKLVPAYLRICSTDIRATLKSALDL